MGLKIFERILGKSGRVETQEVTTAQLCQLAQECRARELAFQCCVNLIAGALGRCEFRTYLEGRETFDENYWIFNMDPNTNESSTVFLHKLVHQLYAENEALVIPTRRKNGHAAYVVADSFCAGDLWPDKQREYTQVTVGALTYSKTFLETEVLHLQLHGRDIRPVLQGVTQSYQKLIQAAERDYLFSNGQHLKVHVSQMASGEEGWEEKFQAMLSAQIEPFLNNAYAILPEMDGWQYEHMDRQLEGEREASSIRAMYDDIFAFTANAFGIPPVLLLGKVEGTKDAVSRFLTACLDPLADQLSEEITRKLYGFEAWQRGSCLRVDTSAVNHFDLFANAANVEKLIGSGYSYNDVQRAAGLPTIDEPWANEHFFTKNFGRAEEILKGAQSE